MRLPQYIIRQRGGFYFRLVVPAHLRPRVGLRVVKRSLCTREPLIAQVRALALASRYHRAFRAMERAMTKSLDELLAGAEAAFQDGRAKELSLTLPNGARLETSPDDPPEVHAELLNMARNLAAAGLAPAAPAPAPASMALATNGPALTLGQAIAEFIPYKRKSITGKTADSYAERLAAFRDHVGADVLLRDIGPEICGAYYLALISPPTSYTKNYAGNILSAIAGLFAWAMTHRHYPKGTNPTHGHKELSRDELNARANGMGWEPFDAIQLGDILNPLRFSMLPAHHRWLPVCLLYTGARPDELATLDLAKIKQAGDWDYIEINRGKTASGLRLVPLHPELIELGFMEYVEQLRAAGETLLFPQYQQAGGSTTSASNAGGKAFSAYLARTGVVKENEDAKIGLRSFRTTVAAVMAFSGTDHGLQERFMGHQETAGAMVVDPGGAKKAGITQSVHHANYAGKAMLKKQMIGPWLDALAKACHPALCWADQGVVDIERLRHLLAQAQAQGARDD